MTFSPGRVTLYNTQTVYGKCARTTLKQRNSHESRREQTRLPDTPPACRRAGRGVGEPHRMHRHEGLWADLSRKRRPRWFLLQLPAPDCEEPLESGENPCPEKRQEAYRMVQPGCGMRLSSTELLETADTLSPTDWESVRWEHTACAVRPPGMIEAFKSRVQLGKVYARRRRELQPR